MQNQERSTAQSAGTSDSNHSPDLDRAAHQIAARLSALGFNLDGTEDAEQLGDLADAIERFEDAVEARGGDLMVDEPPRGAAGQPDDPDFVLPRKADDETIPAYIQRLDSATQRVLGHPR